MKKIIIYCSCIITIGFINLSLAGIIDNLQDHQHLIDADGWVRVSTNELANNQNRFDYDGATEYKVRIQYDTNSNFAAHAILVGPHSLTFKTSSSDRLMQIRYQDKNVVLQCQDGNIENNTTLPWTVVEILESSTKSRALARESNNTSILQRAMNWGLDLFAPAREE